MYPIGVVIALLVALGIAFYPFIRWAEREDEKRSLCPDCGTHLVVADVRPLSDGLYLIVRCPQCPHEEAQFIPHASGIGVP